MQDYVIFKTDMYCDNELHFKAGKKYKIIGEIKGKYAVSYGRKNKMECCLMPKDYDGIEIFQEGVKSSELLQLAKLGREAEIARPLEEWGEDYGDVLWWKFPICEPPYVGSPLDCNWTGYHTHWTPIIEPEPLGGTVNE